MNQHGRALRVNSALLQLGNIAGPRYWRRGVGGFKLALDLLINVPVALVAFLIGVLVFPRQRPSLAGPMDWPGYGSYSVIILGFFHHGVLGTNSRTVVVDAVTRDACVRRSCGFCSY